MTRARTILEGVADEYIVGAAICFNDGRCWVGTTHYECMEKIVAAGIVPGVPELGDETQEVYDALAAFEPADGWMTSEGRFVDRNEGARIAAQTGLTRGNVGSLHSGDYQNDPTDDAKGLADSLLLGESEFSKKMLRQMLQQAGPRPITPIPLTGDEIERVATVLSMGPVRIRDGDQRLLAAGLFQFWEEMKDDGTWGPDRTHVDSVDGAVAAFYDRNGGVRAEWIAISPFRHAQQEAESLKKFLAQFPLRELHRVMSSGGEFTVRPDGVVIRWTPYDRDDPDYGGYSDIVSFDFAEWQAAFQQPLPIELDILDLGFGKRDGSREGPDRGFREPDAEGAE